MTRKLEELKFRGRHRLFVLYSFREKKVVSFERVSRMDRDVRLRLRLNESHEEVPDTPVGGMFDSSDEEPSLLETSQAKQSFTLTFYQIKTKHNSTKS